jgi:hypothetical protein
MTTQVIDRAIAWPGLRTVAAYAFPHPFLWLASLAVFITNGLWLTLSQRIAVEDAWLPEQLTFMGLAALFVFLRAVKPEVFQGILLTFWRGAMTTFFACMLFRNLGIYNHLTMGLNFPMADGLLLSMDRAIGYDWLAVAKIISANPTLNRIIESAYFENTQNGLFAVVIFWLITNRPVRVIEIAYLLIVTAIVCTTISAGFPAESAFAQLADAELKARLPDGTAIYHMKDLLALRSGEPITLVLDKIQGLSTFPSFHTCMALIVMWCSRGFWWSWIPGATLGFLILLATPVFGGHYLVDILFGTSIFIASVWVWEKKLVKRVNVI